MKCLCRREQLKCTQRLGDYLENNLCNCIHWKVVRGVQSTTRFAADPERDTLFYSFHICSCYVDFFADNVGKSPSYKSREGKDVEKRDRSLEQGSARSSTFKGQKNRGQAHEETEIHHGASVQDDVAVNESLTSVPDSSFLDVVVPWRVLLFVCD